MHITCPSGLVFTARKWQIGDLTSLISVKDEAPTSLPKEMVRLAATGVTEPGPYKFKDGTIDVDQLSLPDISVANVLIRLGHDAALLLQPTCESCRKMLKDPVEPNLEEMPVYEASQEGIEHLRTGAPIAREYYGYTLKLKVMRGSDFATLAKLVDQDMKYVLEYQQVLHIAEVSGRDLKEPLVNMLDIREWYHVQEIDLHNEIEADIDELWGGVDQAFTFRCDRCLVEQKQNVPLDMTFYGLGDHKMRSRRQKRSSAMKSAGQLMRTSSPLSSSATRKRRTSPSEE